MERTKILFRGILLLILFGTAFQMVAQTSPASRQTAQTYTSKTVAPGESFGYWQYLPENYTNSGEKVPLVIFLHGMGEKGSDLNLVLRNGPPKMVKNGRNFPFVLISPQARYPWDWSPDFLDEMVNEMINKYNIDTDRVYLTGLSMGGNGVWDYAATSNYSDKLAAIVPIAGWMTKDGCNLKNLPMWAFTGEYDGPGSPNTGTEKAVAAYLKCVSNPTPEPILTVYPGTGHNAWDKAYGDNNMWNWMLAQKRGTTGGGGTPPSSGTPTVSAPADKTITLPTNSISLTATAGHTAGKSVTVKWSKLSGGAATLSGVNTKTLNVSGMVKGSYKFEVVATDGAGQTAKDQVIVIINDQVTNQPPTVSLGADKTITLPTNSIKLTSNASDPEGGALTYSWQKLMGPAATLSGTKSSALSLSNMVEGTYKFRLTVYDNQGDMANDDIFVYVKPNTGGTNPAPAGQFTYNYYEGNYSSLPDFSRLTPKKTGEATDINLSYAVASNTFLLEFIGSITVPTAGEYTFYLTSDDGSKLKINNNVVINNDGLHAAVTKQVKVNMTTAATPFVLEYMQNWGGKELKLEVAGPGISRRVVPSSWFTGSTDPGTTDPGSGSGEVSAVMNVNLTHMTTDINGWNSTKTYPDANVVSKALKTTSGASTSVKIKVGTGWRSASANGMTTNNTDDILPDNVMKTFYYAMPGDKAQIIVTGLDKSLTYNLNLFGSRSGGGDRTTVFSAGGKSGKLQASNNTSSWVSLKDLTPDANGQIVLTVQTASGSMYAYLNAMIIEEIGGTASASAMTSSAAISGINPYPNPFTDYINVGFAEGKSGEANVEIIDANGTVYFQNSYQVTESMTEFRVELVSANIPTGTYYIKVTGAGFDGAPVRILKN
ncbi:PKD domain-containing protein [Marinigracilibium pacificum]|uniref:T9SS type A sorting domain-containing protein n=1 Tax=Marinigracilibium pacificum TaxID=2729599 RepID=A0A848IU13_9BACT|nr:PA14 domain-containing protein [Marinigracilibium pacificum]NMM47226.1 T9SS type A sorting domain-containing protein [Marinigracilibium pacificum]